MNKDIDILSTVIEDHYNLNDEFNSNNGFNIAVAFTAWDNSTDNILDPTYGTLEFKAFEWGFNEEG